MYGLSTVLGILLAIVVSGLVRLQRVVDHTSTNHASTQRVVGILLLLTYLTYPFACKIVSY
jgi:hypothetical protein